MKLPAGHGVAQGAGREPASLRFRLISLLALFFVSFLLLLYLAAHSYAHRAADSSYDRLLGGSALSIAESLSFERGRVQVDIPYAALDMLSAAPDDRVFYRVVGPDGQTVTGYSDLPFPPKSNARAKGEAVVRYFDAPYRGEDMRFVWLGHEVAQAGEIGWIFVQVGQTRNAREALSQETLLSALLPILLMTIFSLFIIWFGFNYALRPLENLSAELAARQPEDLHPVQTSVPREMQPVSSALDDFMRRLSGNIELMRAFIGDAAHQLRTPLAAIQAQAEVGLGGSAEDMRSSLKAARRNAVRLTRLVNQMLSDATVQHRSNMRLSQPFDLAALIRMSIRESVPQSENHDVRFTNDVGAAPMRGDAVMMGEALKNVIQNALTHGKSAHGEVTITLKSLAGGYRLTVEDRGRGIADADREAVFERFARRADGVSGAGLGLAIVRRAIEAQGGSISLNDREGGGLCVAIILPHQGEAA